MSMISERALRDLVAGQLTKIESGLVLLEKEKFVPNSLGTRGFIDIFAKDIQVAEQKYWSGEIDRCDICKHDMLNDEFMVDGKTKMGPWACMCARCFAEVGVKIDWGYGQLYCRKGKQWLNVGGSQPYSDSPEEE